MENDKKLEGRISSKKYERLKAEDLAPSSKKEKNNKLPVVQSILEKQAELPYLIFPDQIQELNTAIKNGSSELSIYIGKTRASTSITSFSPPAPDALGSLETLTIYHFIPKHLYFDEKSVKALSPLLKAPNLRKVTFTHFLAEPFLPLIPSNVEVMFDFQSRHITDPIIQIYILKGHRETALNWLTKYPTHKITIPEILEFRPNSKDIKS